MHKYNDDSEPVSSSKRQKPDFSSLGLPADDAYFKNFNSETEKYIEDLKNGSNNILVAVRVRPLNNREYAQSDFETIRVLDQKVVVLLDPGNEFESDDFLRKNRNKETKFAFDFAFDKTIGHIPIYNSTTAFLIDGVLEGYNATVFAYGATGAGKTYTMVGAPDSPGLMFLTINDLFNKIESFKYAKDFVVKVSYLEIYNENIKDLLTVDDKNLEIREDPLRGVVVTGITEVMTSSTSEIITILKIGNKNRSMEPTSANDVSSRSHAILQVTVEHKDKEKEVNDGIKVAKLSMIDLAGSERAAATNNKGQRMIEGAKINQSLLVLGNCIQALSEQNEKSGKGNFIPYRGSKLTRLLKDSLGGNCRTVMITMVSPGISTFEDTYNTLNYANRAKNIKTISYRNVLKVSNHIDNYGQIISNLKKENDDLKSKLQHIKSTQSPQGISIYSERDKDIVDKLQVDIKSLFQEQLDLKIKIYELELKIETISFNIFKHLSEAKKEEKNPEQKNYNKLKEKVDEQKNTFQSLVKTRDDMQSHFFEICGRIETIQKGLSKTDISEGAKIYIDTLIKQNNLMIENTDYEQKEKLVDTIAKQRALQIAFLQNQLNLRDQIIQDQKKLIDSKKSKGNTKTNSADLVQHHGLLPALDKFISTVNSSNTTPPRKAKAHEKQEKEKSDFTLPKIANNKVQEKAEKGINEKKRANNYTQQPGAREKKGNVNKSMEILNNSTELRNMNKLQRKRSFDLLETSKPKRKKEKQKADIRDHVSNDKMVVLPKINSSSNSRLNSSQNDSRKPGITKNVKKLISEKLLENRRESASGAGGDKLKLIHPRVNLVPRKISDSPYVINFTKNEGNAEEKRERLKKFNLPVSEKAEKEKGEKVITRDASKK